MTAVNTAADLTLEGDIAVLTIDSPPVNALSETVREGLRYGVMRAEADPAAKAIVLICAGRTFIAGADIAEFGKPLQGVSLPEAQETIENCTKPVIAAIHGTALGGGLEVALVCHYRVAVPSAKLGLPEIKLGLIPGAGGTQRLPRLIGPEAAAEAILSGTPFSAKQAKEWGVLDALVEEGKLREGALAFARHVIDAGKPLVKLRDRDDKVAPFRGKPEIFEKIAKAHARKNRGFEAWTRALDAVRDAVELPIDQGLTRERAAFMDLLVSDQSKAQRHVFFAERQVWKIADIPDATPTLPIKKIGMIGAGTMGGGISMNFLNAGLPVTIVETAQAALDRGLGVIRRNYENTAKKGRMSAADVEARMGLLTPALDLTALADCDLIIEAVFENMEIKKEIFGKLDKIAKPGAILASNTSYLDIDEIASATSRPGSVLGMHFFSPANVMRLLEVVRGAKTEKPVVATAMKLAKQIGKIGVLVGVCHGFVGNRMLAERQREAGKLILEGAMPWDVDRVLYDFGMPMGPFAMSDLAGLDIGWSKETSKSESIRDILCEHDRRGQKTGAGFYDYDENRTPKPSPLVEKVILDFAAAKGVNRRTISDQEILQRCLYPMVNEGAKILEEGKAQRASDIDIVWINGYGWPVYTGGPMFWADTVGLAEVLAAMKGYQADDGRRLQALGAAGKAGRRGQGVQGPLAEGELRRREACGLNARQGERVVDVEPDHRIGADLGQVAAAAQSREAGPIAGAEMKLIARVETVDRRLPKLSAETEGLVRPNHGQRRGPAEVDSVGHAMQLGARVVEHNRVVGAGDAVRIGAGGVEAQRGLGGLYDVAAAEDGNLGAVERGGDARRIEIVPVSRRSAEADARTAQRVDVVAPTGNAGLRVGKDDVRARRRHRIGLTGGVVQAEPRAHGRGNRLVAAEHGGLRIAERDLHARAVNRVPGAAGSGQRQGRAAARIDHLALADHGRVGAVQDDEAAVAVDHVRDAAGRIKAEPRASGCIKRVAAADDGGRKVIDDRQPMGAADGVPLRGRAVEADLIGAAGEGDEIVGADDVGVRVREIDGLAGAVDARPVASGVDEIGGRSGGGEADRAAAAVEFIGGRDARLIREQPAAAEELDRSRQRSPAQIQLAAAETVGCAVDHDRRGRTGGRQRHRRAGGHVERHDDRHRRAQGTEFLVG